MSNFQNGIDVFLSEAKSFLLALWAGTSQMQSLSRTDVSLIQTRWSGELVKADTSLSWRLSKSKTCLLKHSLHLTIAYNFQKRTLLLNPDIPRNWTHLKSRNLPKSVATCLKQTLHSSRHHSHVKGTPLWSVHCLSQDARHRYHADMVLGRMSFHSFFCTIVKFEQLVITSAVTIDRGLNWDVKKLPNILL